MKSTTTNHLHRSAVLLTAAIIPDLFLRRTIMSKKSKIRCGGLIYFVSFVLVLNLVLASAVKADLIGWWRFNDDFLDSSGLGNDGIPKGNPTFVEGYVGFALELDGNDYVVIDAVSDDFTDNDITLSAWVKTSDRYAKWFSCNTGHRGNQVRLAIVGGKFGFDTDTEHALSTTTVSDGEWHLLTFVRSGNIGYTYVDGVMENSYEPAANYGANYAGYTSDFTSNDLWSIGQEWDGPGPSDFLTGIVDDARIYDRALFEAEILVIMEYDTGLGVPSPDFNGDGIVDSADMRTLVDHWHTDNALYDIAPEPFGDGIVDVQDLIALSEYLTKELDDPTLLAHWALDETESDIAFDSAGINDAFVIGNPLWQPTGGLVDGAIELDGVDDYIITAPFLNPAVGPFSVLAWIKGGAPGQVVISAPGGVNWLGTDPLDGFLMTELTKPGRGAAPLLSETTITDGQWHRIGFVWDGSNRTLYVDSVAVAHDIEDSLKSSSNGLNIGTGKAMKSGTYWSGLIDDVRIYNRTLIP